MRLLDRANFRCFSSSWYPFACQQKSYFWSSKYFTWSCCMSVSVIETHLTTFSVIPVFDLVPIPCRQLLLASHPNPKCNIGSLWMNSKPRYSWWRFMSWVGCLDAGSFVVKIKTEKVTYWRGYCESPSFRHTQIEYIVGYTVIHRI
jgi:hypothetical protein